MDLSTREHLQSNRMFEKMISYLAKITNAAIAERKKLAKSLQSFLKENRVTHWKNPLGKAIWKKCQKLHTSCSGCLAKEVYRR